MDARVAIIKGKTPKESVLKGIEMLGGISKFINNNDLVFIKINLNLPNGFPSNSNLEVVSAVIRACKDAGAGKIYVGSFPYKYVPIKSLESLLGLKSFFENVGAELAILDNSQYLIRSGKDQEFLRSVKKRTFSKIQLNNKEILVPNVILKSDKLILINQINVDPLFKCTLSLLNFYSIIPNKYQEFEKVQREGKNYCEIDQYKKDLISNIIKVNTIKKPNLVINDLFYVLEGAGPYIYKDSRLNKVGLVAIGNDAVAVDIITLKLLNLDILKNDLLLKAKEMRLGTADISQIDIIGEKLENLSKDIKPCALRLQDINIKNFSIISGQFCSGCFKQAYHLLNLMKTNMFKDLKYLSKNSFLIGENPLEPGESNHFIVFGDCAIKTTQNLTFRVLKKEKKSKISIFSKKRVKEKENRNILELHGCPPDLFNSIEKIVRYYGKNQAPTLKLFYETLKYVFNKKIRRNYDNWERITIDD
ncbi:MAG: DUF362 domain-containing protein [Promethearchaeota archaeon]